MNQAVAKSKSAGRLRFGLRTILAVIAGVAVLLASLDSWLRAPYLEERRAAAALTRLGGKIVMVDSAPRWRRQYVSSRILDMNVAAVLDLSGSRVTDDDLAHLRAFQHFGMLNLAVPRSAMPASTRSAQWPLPDSLT